MGLGLLGSFSLSAWSLQHGSSEQADLLQEGLGLHRCFSREPGTSCVLV